MGVAGVVVYNNDIVLQEKVNIFSELESARTKYIELLAIAREQRGIIDSFQGQISNIGHTVGRLEKLSQTDPELLMKYSKVYFLNENYVPAKLTDIDKQYIYNGSSNYLIHADVWLFLKKLLENAHSSDVELLITSAFRSFDTQSSLKSQYKVVYGAGTANQFSAEQGYSEHQLGTTVDFTTPAVGGVFANFKADPAHEWLEKNAYKYGFILSYPEGNSYYMSEPWHWRFVGMALADMLHKEGKYFYDLDQREIDPYLINIFD